MQHSKLNRIQRRISEVHERLRAAPFEEEPQQGSEHGLHARCRLSWAISSAALPSFGSLRILRYSLLESTRTKRLVGILPVNWTRLDEQCHPQSQFVLLARQISPSSCSGDCGYGSYLDFAASARPFHRVMAKPFSDDPSVKLFTLQSTNIRVTITNVGATVTSLTVPDKQGESSSYMVLSVHLGE